MYLHDRLIAEGVSREEYRERMRAARQEALARHSPGPAGPPALGGGASNGFWTLVEQFQAQGLRRGQAIRRAVAERPDLHRAWRESR
jgi:hypothetical protein